jgi:hypothetical protein
MFRAIHDDARADVKIHIYTDIDTLFGQACRVWMKVLLDAGHDAELVDIGTDNSQALPDLGPGDVNLLVVGIYAFARFKIWGLPKHGKNVLWMFDPLTRHRDAAMHGHKAAAFDAIAPQLDAVIAMDSAIEQYVQGHHSHLLVRRIPYLVAGHTIATPLAEALRSEHVIFLGGPTERRHMAEASFRASGTPAEFVWAGIWGTARYEKRRRCRISLNIHADPAHTYFDQFRTLEAWAAGTVVVTETTDGLEPWGIVPGVHLAMADLKDLPAVCDELLRDPVRRARMTTDAQALLRAEFSPDRWRRDMLAVLDAIF